MTYEELAQMHGSCTTKSARLGDDSLILQVQQQDDDSVGARNELIERYHAFARRVVRQTAAQWSWTRLRPDVIEDVEQEAVFAMLEAVRRYDGNKSRLPRGRAFRTFLQRVVAARTTDFFRRQHRQYLRDRRPPYGTIEALMPVDPAIRAEQVELYRSLQGALAQLNNEERRMWRLLASGERLVSIAVRLNISYHMAKRRRRRLLCRLRCHLRESE